MANGENVLSRRAPGCNSGILPLVWVDVNNVQVSTLLDSGSKVSFVARQLVKRLGSHERPASLEIATIAGVEKIRTSTVSLRLVGDVTLDRHGVFVAGFILVPIARDLSCYSDLQGVPYHQSADILIGQDYGFVFRDLDVVSGAPEEPVAIRTVLGWTVSGPFILMHRVFLISFQPKVSLLRTLRMTGTFCHFGRTMLDYVKMVIMSFLYRGSV